MLPANEKRISLKAAARHDLFTINDRPLSVAAVYRKVLTGGKGRDGQRHKLETEMSVRGTLVTSPEAIVRFVEAINGGTPPPPTGPVQLVPRLAVSKAMAAAALDAAGIA